MALRSSRSAKLNGRLDNTLDPCHKLLTMIRKVNSEMEDMKILVFDTETTGLPLKGDQNAFEQPWVIQLGAVLLDLREDKCLGTINTLVVPPEGVKFHEGAVRVHGLSEELVRSEGRPMVDVMLELRDMRRQANIVSAYNLAFDERLVRTSSERSHEDFVNDPVLGTAEDTFHHCIMNQATVYFKGRRKLEQVYRDLKGVGIEDAHDAMADTLAAAEVFKMLTVRMLGTAGE